MFNFVKGENLILFFSGILKGEILLLRLMSCDILKYNNFCFFKL